MELVSLDVECFGCVARARVTFKAGLNVLYGANEVGKSSLARAIRFALLLPSSSSAADTWSPWSGGGDPTVTLVFKNGTDFYKVKKVFGTSTASLDRSADGIAWVNLARAREVEARLRALLQWGIPEPGGAKAPKGLPESFLASALLADQDEVASIFERDMKGDGADSGRARVRAALQAIAQDPLFKSVLDIAQGRVDEAFTHTGQRKRGAGDPFRKMADDVAARQRERDEAEKVATDGRVLEQRVTQLQRDTALAEGDLQEKSALREKLENKRARQIALAKAVEEKRKGQALVDAVTEAERKVKEAGDLLDELEPSLPGLRKTAEDKQRAFETATAGISAAQEKRRGEIALQETAILREREVIRERQACVDVALDLRKADELRQRGDEVEHTLTALDNEIAVFEAVEPWIELRAAMTSLEAANQRKKKAADLAAKAIDRRSRAAEEWPAAHSMALPDAKRLGELRNQRQKLELAEAKLDVGLSVEVRGAPSATVSVDGAAQEAKASPFAVEAKKSAVLKLGTGIEISVRGGQAADRENAERLRKAWHDATASIFETVAVVDFVALEEACRVDAEKKAGAEALTREAHAADAERAALGDQAEEMQRLSTRIGELEARLQGNDVGQIKAVAEAHGSHARAVLAKKTSEREIHRSTVAQHRAQEAVLRERMPASTIDTAIVDLGGEVSAIAQAVKDLNRRDQKIADERRLMDAPPSKDDALEKATMSAKKALEDVTSRISAATNERESWCVRLQERRHTAAGVDVAALTAAESAALAAFGDDRTHLDEAVLGSALKAEETTRNRHETLLGQLRTAEGALHASGGAAADEHLRDLEEALRRAHEKQSALEDDYEAWKLLVETLKEAEKNQATHLGNVLAPDIATRLQALAGQRYRGIALSPHLGIEGIDIAGGRRELDRLSVGTREQLSTLFRLCLAERLHAALLLDDQLVQSDPDRLRWFRHALRQTASTGVQVVVLTCRPDDYLESAEIPSPHIIDLGAVVAG